MTAVFYDAFAMMCEDYSVEGDSGDSFCIATMFCLAEAAFTCAAPPILSPFVILKLSTVP